MAVNRNDPCPCGSGKKYKHCHMKIDQATARSGESSRDVRRVITPRTIPYFFWKRFNVARSRSEFGLIFEMTHPEGPYRSRFESRVDFFAHAQSHPLPSGPGWYLAKIKIDRYDAWLLSERGLDDPTTQQVEVELMHLRRTADGWRLWDVKTDKVRKPEEGTPFLAFDVFGIESAEYALHKRLQEGYTRPDLADRVEGAEPAWASPEVLKAVLERRARTQQAQTEEERAADEAAAAAEAEAMAEDAAAEAEVENPATES